MFMTFVGLCISFIIVCFDLSGTAVLLPAMHRAIHLSFSEVQWIINIYVIMMASITLIAGKLANRIGYKYIFLIGLVIFAGGSFLCGFAQSAIMEIAGRTLQGIGAAIIFPIGVAIVKHLSPDDKVSTNIGFFIAFNATMFAIGGFIAGLFTHYLTWRYFFYINIPISAVAFIVIAFAMKKITHREKIPIDWIGLLLIIVSVLSLVFGLMNAPVYGWLSWWIIGAFAVFIISTALFIWLQIKTSHPLIKFSILKNPHLNSLLFITACMQAGFMTLMFFMLFVQMNWKFTPIEAGLIGAFSGAAMVIISIIHGTLVKWFSEQVVFFVGQLFVFVGLILMTLSVYFGFVWLMIGLFSFGLGMPTLLASAITFAFEMVKAEDQAITSSLVFSVRFIGGSVGFAIQGSIIGLSMIHLQKHHMFKTLHFFIAMLVITIFSLIATILSTKFLFFKRTI